jgi:hypothetical protein
VDADTLRSTARCVPAAVVRGSDSIAHLIDGSRLRVHAAFAAVIIDAY